MENQSSPAPVTIVELQDLGPDGREDIDLAIRFVSRFGQSSWWEESTLKGCIGSIVKDERDEDDVDEPEVSEEVLQWVLRQQWMPRRAD